MFCDYCEVLSSCRNLCCQNKHPMRITLRGFATLQILFCSLLQRVIFATYVCGYMLTDYLVIDKNSFFWSEVPVMSINVEITFIKWYLALDLFDDH